MTNTTEIIRKSYRVNGKEYEVGQVLQVPKRISKMLLELQRVIRALDDTIEELYTVSLFPGDKVCDEDLGLMYFVDHNGLNSERQYLTGCINRELYKHFGAFVPVRLELMNDPKVIVREFDKDEAHAATASAIRDTLGINDVALPAIKILSNMDPTGTASVTPVYPAWKTTGAMVFKSTVTQVPLVDVTSGDTMREHVVVKGIVAAFETVAKDRNIPYAVISIGADSAACSAVNPSASFTAEYANNLYLNTLALTDSNKDNMVVFNVFAEVEMQTGTAVTHVTVMYHASKEGKRTSAAVRFLREGDKLVYKDFMTEQDILEKAKALSTRK